MSEQFCLDAKGRRAAAKGQATQVRRLDIPIRTFGRNQATPCPDNLAPRPEPGRTQNGHTSPAKHNISYTVLVWAAHVPDSADPCT